MTQLSSLTLPERANLTTTRDTRIREAAQALEASFVSEMLKSTGFGETSETFGGGIGEEQFASMQRDLVAKQIVAKGGLGLAEMFFDALKETDHGTPGS